jgi:hypothetical protein
LGTRCAGVETDDDTDADDDDDDEASANIAKRRERLDSFLEQNKDATLDDMVFWLNGEGGIATSRTTMWRDLGALDWACKVRPVAPWAGQGGEQAGQKKRKTFANIWGHLKHNAGDELAEDKSGTAENKKRLVERAWKKRPAGTVTRHAKWFRVRLQQCIDREGGRTDY